ncbi:MAG: glycoside hydrolase family 3 protein [Desulforhopalus sp.]
MQSASLQQKIGQLFLIGFAGDTLTPNHPIIEDITARNLGGVILFDRLLATGQHTNNIINGDQLRRLTDSLQNHAGGNLLIAVDQEGGKVSRFNRERGFPVTPTPWELGADSTLRLTAQSARQTARMLKDAGIILNLAPVVDLNVYPQNPIIGRYGRSFSTSVEDVIAHAAVWIEAHRDQGLLSCLKHFPGHGSSRSDSHLGFVNITETWQEIELYPYQRLIEAGLVDAIMLGHLFHKAFDAHYPMTMSRPTIENRIRSQLGFQGPVLSDDMQMKAITDHYGLEDACCRALSAGIDLMIIGNNLEHDPLILPKIVDAIMVGVEKKTIRKERIEEAFRRIQILKQSPVTR